MVTISIRQLTNEINLVIPGCGLTLEPGMAPPSEAEARLLRQLVLSGAVDRVARRVDDEELRDAKEKQRWRGAYRTQDMEDPVFLPSSSVLRKDLPKWVVYQEVYETAQRKMLMRNVCAIEPEWLAVFAPKLCSFSDPLESPEPRYDAARDVLLCHRRSTFGPAAWEMADVEVPFPHTKDYFKWFAYALMRGRVCPLLAPFAEHVFDPRTLVSAVAIRYKTQREGLLRALMGRNACTLQDLRALWLQQPTYLLRWGCRAGDAMLQMEMSLSIL